MTTHKSNSIRLSCDQVLERGGQKLVESSKTVLPPRLLDLPTEEFLAFLDKATPEELESLLETMDGSTSRPLLAGTVARGKVSPEFSSSLSVILWWELRRPFFNLLVGLCGILTLIALVVLNHLPAAFLLFGAFSYFCGVNLFYTTGWLLHLLVHNLSPEDSQRFGKRLFFSVTALAVLTTLAIAVLLPLTFMLNGIIGAVFSGL